jgi:hypothetical protein
MSSFLKNLEEKRRKLNLVKERAIILVDVDIKFIDPVPFLHVYPIRNNTR